MRGRKRFQNATLAIARSVGAYLKRNLVLTEKQLRSIILNSKEIRIYRTLFRTLAILSIVFGLSLIGTLIYTSHFQNIQDLLVVIFPIVFLLLGYRVIKLQQSRYKLETLQTSLSREEVLIRIKEAYGDSLHFEIRPELVLITSIRKGFFDTNELFDIFLVFDQDQAYFAIESFESRRSGFTSDFGNTSKFRIEQKEKLQKLLK